MKKNRKVEIKIYEILGIKAFRKMAFKFCLAFLTLFTLSYSKKERKEALYGNPSNYTVGNNVTFDGFKKFKKSLRFNASVHTAAAIWCIGHLLTGSSLIIPLIALILNLYCVMLQRYNQIRIEDLLERHKSRYEKKKQELQEELINNEILLQNTYSIVDKKGNESSINYVDLINSINSVEKLKEYRRKLIDYCASVYVSGVITIPYEKKKTLKVYKEK